MNKLQLLKREIKWGFQRAKRGYSDADLWNANDTIAKIVLAFIEINQGSYPMGYTEKQSEKRKDEIIWLMTEHLSDETPIKERITPEYQKRFKKACKIFGEDWMGLWD